MPLGQQTHEAVSPKVPSQTLEDLERAMRVIGKVESVDKSAHAVTGTVRYGLQNVNIRASVKPHESGSSITVWGMSDDIWAAGAKSAIQRLLEALENIDDPSYVPSKSGVSKTNLILQMVLSIVILLAVFGGWITGIIPMSVMRILFFMGAGLFIYFVVAKARFRKR